VVPVSSPEVAEMSKLLENTFRFINISFVNEMAMICDRLGISIWEVIQAAASKPFAFMPHYPSAGVGGHCIPIVPFYLEAVAQRHGVAAELVEAAGRINDTMPGFVVDKLERELSAAGGCRRSGRRVLAIGVTYKPDVADLRESAALRVLECLIARGFEVSYHDPLVEQVVIGERVLWSQPLDSARNMDAVVLLTPHSSIDYSRLLDEARLVLDTSNALPNGTHGRARLVPL
jgi:UDP-N-acetyl-D-glucosamine dehydrogenase